ncbi:DUF1641 domain-containing protein [Bacillus sp. FJAT-42315]|uniref:DUF1641 domain-containing protein n=1 Tax=Bacillus sp. FJAT-42315 TaxID=2014077 RepID=UPI000C24172B|nr:DUF1641 domain-containing protein [Bacillus sp. FJAT-42315]
MATSLSKQDWVDELDKLEVQASLQKLIEKLPTLTEKLEQVDNILSFGQAAMEDQHTMEKVKMKLDYTNVDIDTLEAGLRLLEKLPLLLQLTEKLETVVHFMEQVLGDQKSIEYLQKSAEGYLEPIQEKVEQGKTLWEEVQMKAEANTQHISVFTILKWMKDPSVQRGLSYVQALIDTLPKKQ